MTRITMRLWRQNRVPRLEAGVLTLRAREAPSGPATSGHVGDAQARGWIRDAAGADALSKLARYETHLDRGLHRDLHELQRLQARRRGETVAPPALLEVDVSTEDR